MSSWGFQLPKRAFAAGEELKGTVLFVKGSYPELPNNALAETIRTTMGIGGKPSYSLESRIGQRRRLVVPDPCGSAERRLGSDDRQGGLAGAIAH